MQLFIFLLTVAVIAGAVAAGGDWMGHRAARRKIRIGGMRPRHASTLIAVITGVVIALATYGIVLAIWKEAREALTSYGKVKADLSIATNELSSMEGQLQEAQQRVEDADQRVVDAESKADELNGQLSTIRGQIIELTIELDTKNEEFDKLQKQVDKADRDLRDKQAEAEKEQFQVRSLRELKDKLGQDIEEIERQMAELLEGDVVMRRGTYLAYQRVINNESSNLSEIMQNALNRVNVNLTRDGLKIDSASAARAEEFIEAYPYSGESLIIISAARNVFTGFDVLLEFEARQLDSLVGAGETVLEVEIRANEAAFAVLGGGRETVGVPDTFTADTVREFTALLGDRLTSAAELAGFLPNLSTGRIALPISLINAKSAEIIGHTRPFTISVRASAGLHALDGLENCTVTISGPAAQ